MYNLTPRSSEDDMKAQSTDEIIFESSLEDNETGGLLSSYRQGWFNQNLSQKRSRYIVVIFLLIITWIITVAFGVLFVLQFNLLGKSRTYETGFSTELVPAFPEIELVEQRFTGGLKFDKSGMVYRHIESGSTQYVGEPTEELDAAWVDLFEPQAVDLIGDEAKTVVGRTFQKPGGWWLTGLDVMHQLHCLNMIRQGLRLDYYNGKSYFTDPPEVWRVHLDHCIDVLRQTLMCHGDSTMVVIDWSEQMQRIVPDFETVHTCRNFTKLREWTVQRSAAQHTWKPQEMM